MLPWTEYRRGSIRHIWGSIQYHGRSGAVTAEGLLSSGSAAHANFRSWPKPEVHLHVDDLITAAWFERSVSSVYAFQHRLCCIRASYKQSVKPGARRLCSVARYRSVKRSRDEADDHVAWVPALAERVERDQVAGVTRFDRSLEGFLLELRQITDGDRRWDHGCPDFFQGTTAPEIAEKPMCNAEVL